MSSELRTIDRDLSVLGIAFPCAAGNLEIRERIVALEELIRRLPQYEFPILHHYGHGVYGREMQMPRGSIVISRIHRHENLNILSQGQVTVISEFGFHRYSAPAHIEAPAGTKRVIVAHSDVVWTTLYGTDEKDPEKVLSRFYAETFDEVPELAFIDAEAIETLGEA